MKTYLKQVLKSGAALALVAGFSVVIAGASGSEAKAGQAGQQYYPLIVATIDPATGQQQQHTIYVPVAVANSVASGQGVYTAAPQVATLPSDPWAAQSISATGNIAGGATEQGQVTGTVVSAASIGQAGQTAAYGYSAAGTPSTAYYGAATAGNVANANTRTLAAAPAAAPTPAPVTNPRDMPLPTWVGQNTTYNTAMGQEMIAPEINKTNMLSMTQHLRRLGYIVPDSLDEAIRTAPSKTRVALVESMGKIQNAGSGDSPMMQALGKISKDLEANYGFSFTNILDNSMRILDSK